MATRNQERATRARASIASDVPDADLEIRELDLASLGSVRGCADAIVDGHERVDLLINSAGIMGIPDRTTAEGSELQVGVNHLGHFVLTARLLPALLRAPSARVVSVTSFARYTGRSLDPEDPYRPSDPWLAYGDSKLANLQFSVELERRLSAAGADVLSVAAHPGLSNTDLQARSVRETRGGFSQRFWHLAARYVGMPPRRGALPQLRAATDPRAEGGQLYGPRWMTFGTPVPRPVLGRSRDVQKCRRLWELSERETGERFDVGAAVAGNV